VGALRDRFPAAEIVGLLPRDDFEGAEDTVDRVAHSFEEAVDHASAHYAKVKTEAIAAIA